MSQEIVLAHAGEESLPILIPIVLVVIFTIVKARRDANRPDDEERSDGRDSGDP